jgi:hypothetical protein
LFKKIDVKFPTIELNKLLGQRESILSSTAGDLFKEYEISDIDYFNQIFENVLQFDIPPNKRNITIIEKFGATPHTDFWPVALNIYLEIDGNENTIFYDNPSRHRINVPDVPGLYFYDPKLLVEANRFLANPNDCYLLNTHIPHAVTNENDNRRIIMRLVWFYEKFDAVLNSIKIIKPR